MRWVLGAVGAASLVGTSEPAPPPRREGRKPANRPAALAQAESQKVVDSVTGLTWSSYSNEKGVTFRVAVPDTAAGKADFDAAFQIIAPANLGWVGLAWGGSMTYNPLAIVWPNKQDVVVSSRMA